MAIGTVCVEAAQLVDLTAWINNLTIAIRNAHVILRQNARSPEAITPAQFGVIYAAMSNSNIEWTLKVAIKAVTNVMLKDIDMRTASSGTPLLKNGQPLGPIEENSLTIYRVWIERECALLERREEVKNTIIAMFGVRDPAWGGQTDPTDQNKILMARAVWKKMPVEDEQTTVELKFLETFDRFESAVKVLYNADTGATQYFGMRNGKLVQI